VAIRWRTEPNALTAVCSKVSYGEGARKGASALIKTPRMESHADAPGHDATASRRADGPAGRLPAVLHCPSFRAFCALAAGFLAQTSRRTVCGMLTGAGLSRVWRHDRAHRFFSHARWSAQDLGLVLAKLIVAALVPEGEPVLVAIDDTLFTRTGRTVHAIGWFHDGSAKGRRQAGLGNNWVIAAIVVRLPFCSRPMAPPALARLVHKDIKPAPASRPGHPRHGRCRLRCQGTCPPARHRDLDHPAAQRRRTA